MIVAQGVDLVDLVWREVLAAALFAHESAAFGVRVSAWFGGELLLGAGGVVVGVPGGGVVCWRGRLG
jgi:hypothetical protein